MLIAISVNLYTNTVHRTGAPVFVKQATQNALIVSVIAPISHDEGFYQRRRSPLLYKSASHRIFCIQSYNCTVSHRFAAFYLCHFQAVQTLGVCPSAEGSGGIGSVNMCGLCDTSKCSCIGYDISGVAPDDDVVRLLHHFVYNDWFPHIISCCFGCKKAPGWDGAKIKQTIGDAHGFQGGRFLGR